MLAGGRGSRLGGVEKGELRIHGERLIDIVIEGAREAGCRELVIAGDLEAAGALTLREEPAFGGPVAGLAAALPETRSEWIMLLACDLPHARLLCRMLARFFREMAADMDGLVAVYEGRIQWLAGIYRRTSIEAALERTGEPDGTSLKAILGGLKLREVQDHEGLSRDLDTPQDLEAFTAREE